MVGRSDNLRGIREPPYPWSCTYSIGPICSQVLYLSDEEIHYPCHWCRYASWEYFDNAARFGINAVPDVDRRTEIFGVYGASRALNKLFMWKYGGRRGSKLIYVVFNGRVEPEG